MTPIRWYGIALAAILALTGCNKGTESGSAAEVVVRIGSAAPLTGPQSHLGKDNENGPRLAIEELNAQNFMIGGKRARFELVGKDDQADPKTAAIVAQELVDEKVSGVIGHLNSGTTRPAARIYSDAGIPEITPSATATDLTQQGYKTLFRMMANDSRQGTALAEFAVKKFGAKKIAVVDDRTAYGQGLADHFAEVAAADGATVVDREYVDDKKTEFRAILTAIKSKNPDLIFYGGMDTQAGPMIAQLKTLGIGAQFLSGDGARSPAFIQLGGAATEGAIASTPGLPLEKMPGGAAFAEKFTAKYGPIQNYSPFAYDAVMTLADAMQKAGSSEPARYLPALAAIKREGVTGPIEFDANGDLTNSAVTIYQVKDGRWQTLEVFGADTAGR
ncbi:MAG TPA: branched-chain amino acid ABC transporter substrate-binding protein [Burkholderiales bacterium]|nr:branched-chain amino acid ABC transporter substrate-binding protein [Burkholderiales bacterium]